MAEEQMALPGPIRRWVMIGLMALLSAFGGWHGARAYTDAEARQIFGILDSDHDGKVTKVEFEANKVDAFFFRNRKNPDENKLTYEQTGLSREFFDKADQGHKGYLTGLDMIDAIHFEDIDVTHRGYFDFNDLVAGLKTISR
jgi:hypothetical protein